MKVRTKFITELARKGLTLKKLSELSSVSSARLGHIKRGMDCNEETAIKISKALNGDVNKLFKK